MEATAAVDIDGEVIVQFPLPSRFYDMPLDFSNYNKDPNSLDRIYASSLNYKFRTGKYYINKAGKFIGSKRALGNPGYIYVHQSWDWNTKSYEAHDYEVRDYAQYYSHSHKPHGVHRDFNLHYNIII